jgi:TM2 domain-containing membrane protein YozV
LSIIQADILKMVMDTTNLYMQLPGVTAGEIHFLQQFSADLNETQQNFFFNNYTAKRKSPQDMLNYCLIAIIIPGFQRFMIKQIGWAVVYFFTGGLFFVMTVMDLVNHKKLVLDYDQQVAYESYQLAKMIN